MIELDRDIKIVKKNGEILELSENEFKVIEYLYDNKDRIVSRAELIDYVYGLNDVEYSAFTKVMTYVRKALNDNHKNPKYIKTIFKKGFQWIN